MSLLPTPFRRERTLRLQKVRLPSGAFLTLAHLILPTGHGQTARLFHFSTRRWRPRKGKQHHKVTANGSSWGLGPPLPLPCLDALPTPGQEAWVRLLLAHTQAEETVRFCGEVGPEYV